MTLSNPLRETLNTRLFRPDTKPVVWERAKTLVPYDDAIRTMERHVAEMASGASGERVWLVEHSSIYTAGTNAQDSDLITPERFPVFKTGRGGEYTYHGPGQRVAYPMLDLGQRGKDVRVYVRALEDWMINTLDQFNIKGERREDRVGVWVLRPDKPPLADGTAREDKIAAIGIRIRKWISFHGVSLNVEPDLEHYSGIVSCGVQGHGVTSLVDLGLPVTMEDVDLVLKQEFEKLFGPVEA